MWLADFFYQLMMGQQEEGSLLDDTDDTGQFKGDLTQEQMARLKSRFNKLQAEVEVSNLS